MKAGHWPVAHIRGAIVAAACALGACALGACGSPAPSKDAGPDNPSDLVGTFKLTLDEAGPTHAARALVSGKVYAGPVPDPAPRVVVRKVGDCQFLEPSLPFCPTACGSHAQCSAGDVCVPYPDAVDLGGVSVTGLVVPVDLTTSPPSFNYQSDELPASPCEEGTDVTLASGAFSLSTACVAPLLVPKEPTWPVRRGQSLALSWTAAAHPDLARISVRLDIAHHGGAASQIACDVADTGAFEIPATLIDDLLDRGVAGFPSIILTRATTVHALEQPQLAFSVVSTVERAVDTGVTSCLADDVCPPGSLCDPKMLVCRASLATP